MNEQIISTRKFDGFPVRFIRSDHEDVGLWMTAEDVGNVLELEEPLTDIEEIFRQHRDELEEFTMRMPSAPERGSCEILVFSEEGVYLAAFFCDTPKAKAFRRWVAGKLKF